MSGGEIIGRLEIVAAQQLAAVISGDWDGIIRLERTRAGLLAGLAARFAMDGAISATDADRLRDVAHAGDEVAAALQRHLSTLRRDAGAVRQLRNRSALYAKAIC